MFKDEGDWLNWAKDVLDDNEQGSELARRPSKMRGEKKPSAEQILQQVRNSREYKSLGENQGNQRAQMLFDTLATHHGNDSAVYHMARFAGGRESEDDFRGFRIGENTDRSAARHFFWSAHITLGANSPVAATLGYAKEAYALAGRNTIPPLFGLPGPLRGAGHFDAKDLATNAAGRRFGRDLEARRRKLPWYEMDTARVTLSPYTEF